MLFRLEFSFCKLADIFIKNSLKSVLFLKKSTEGCWSMLSSVASQKTKCYIFWPFVLAHCGQTVPDTEKWKIFLNFVFLSLLRRNQVERILFYSWKKLKSVLKIWYTIILKQNFQFYYILFCSIIWIFRLILGFTQLNIS